MVNMVNRVLGVVCRYIVQRLQDEGRIVRRGIGVLASLSISTVMMVRF